MAAKWIRRASRKAGGVGSCTKDDVKTVLSVGICEIGCDLHGWHQLNIYGLKLNEIQRGISAQ